jgi:hypothetical protein
MLKGAVQSLLSGLRSPALRRSIAVICACAFLFVTFADSVSHLNQSRSTSVVHVDQDTPGKEPLSSKKSLATVEHCFACTLIAIFTPATASLTWNGSADRVAWLPPADIVPSPPGIETPPPRFSI